ncbi:MAG: PQQ-like beta-propeller repeat protein [Candidatus Poribacteria bacterium]|nr:PQQ-like beta-propeller repeat protein [Candidatus Poribacteria bacterium]
MRFQMIRKTEFFLLYLLLILHGGILAQFPTDAWAAEWNWPGWRGPNQNGVSHETGLISNWSQDGENLMWKADFIGRSTPIVLNGRVYVIGRVGQDITEQEQVACFDAETGKLLWQHRINVFHSTIPFNRLGWASLAGDTNTGNIYAHTISGIFLCFTGKGEIVWSRSLTEEFGRISGYGGRIHTPVVTGNLVIISFLNTSWGSHVVPRHRYFALDKNTGDVVWVAAPGGRPLDTTYSTPIVAAIKGQFLLIAGNADGSVYAMDVRTGETVWGFKLSKRGIQSSVVVDGTKVYACQGEENVDSTAMGRVVCIDATGTGDVTSTHEIWRYDECQVGYASPAIHEGRLYVVDNSANLHSLDAETGAVHWQHSLGTVGKGSPVCADGKIYVTEVNGHFHILRPSGDACQSLDTKRIERQPGHYAEIYGSPAIANGRIYFTTEEGLYCLGAKNVNSIRIVPADVLTRPGNTVQFTVRAFDNSGKFNTAEAAEWSLNGLVGTIGSNGVLTLNENGGGQAGTVSARVGHLQDAARVRVVPEFPWVEDFESIEDGKNPPHWVGAGSKYVVRAKDGNKVLVKSPVKRGLNRSNVYIGLPAMRGYTVQIDAMGTKPKRNLPDMGLIANRYTLDLMGNHQRLQIRSWASDLRMAKHIDYTWEPYVWYTIKLTVNIADDKAMVKGKVWRTGEPEPASWTITVEDPLPNREGSPGIYGYSPSEIYYDNLKVWGD